METSERITELRLAQIEAAINLLATGLQVREQIAQCLQDLRDNLQAAGKPAPQEAFDLLRMLKGSPKTGDGATQTPAFPRSPQ